MQSDKGVMFLDGLRRREAAEKITLRVPRYITPREAAGAVACTNGLRNGGRVVAFDHSGRGFSPVYPTRLRVVVNVGTTVAVRMGNVKIASSPAALRRREGVAVFRGRNPNGKETPLTWPEQRAANGCPRN
jgi:hypothetical protein